jgi:16S rRNA (guanine966-N2)-methyltransferase
MRVIAGAFKGRRLVAPAGSLTRPTGDRVREALFSSLVALMGPGLGNGAVLDLFAGSGALGIEALSRGCTRATFVERDRRALQALERNLAATGIQKAARVVKGDAVRLVLGGMIPGGPFALILLDPPYRLAVTEVASVVSALGENRLLADGAVVVVERDAASGFDWPPEYRPHARKTYGSTEIDIAVNERGDKTS